MRRFLLKSAFIFFAIQILGIVSCFEDCQQQYFRVLDLFVENANRNESDYLRLEEVAGDQTIKYDAYAIAVTNGVEYYSDSFFSYPGSNPFITTGLACDVSEPLAGDKITNLLIWSNADLQLENGDIIAAGQYLNTVFDVDYRDNKPISVSDFLQGSESSPYEHIIFLQLNTAPLERQAHRFYVRYDLDNGDRFMSATERIYIEQ